MSRINSIVDTHRWKSKTLGYSKPMEIKDSNGNLLTEGDSVTVIKSLKVRGAADDIKRGQVVKNIRLTDNEEEIEGKVNGTMLVLKTCFLKKV